MANEFAESKCYAGMWFHKNMREKHKDFIMGLAKRLFRGKKYIVTKSKGMITIKGWIKTETNGEK